MSNLTAVNEAVFLSEEQYQHILNHIKYDKIKERIEHEESKKTFDEDIEIYKFLNNLNDRTRKIYTSIIEDFREYITHLLDVTPLTVDAYISDLVDKYSPATVRLYASALSSLYNRLYRLGYVSANPFSKCILPQNKRSKELQVPGDAEVHTIINFYEELYFSSDKRKADSARKMIGALLLMTRLGLRVGALEKLTVTGNTYMTTSKGKVIKGNMDDTLKKTITYIGFDLESSSKPFWELNKPLIQFNLNKALTFLNNSGKIKHIYHAHSFRHYYAVKVYREHNDIYMVSRLLNHSGIAVTQRYLESLELDKE